MPFGMLEPLPRLQVDLEPFRLHPLAEPSFVFGFGYYCRCSRHFYRAFADTQKVIHRPPPVLLDIVSV